MEEKYLLFSVNKDGPLTFLWTKDGWQTIASMQSGLPLTLNECREAIEAHTCDCYEYYIMNWNSYDISGMPDAKSLD